VESLTGGLRIREKQMSKNLKKKDKLVGDMRTNAHHVYP